MNSLKLVLLALVFTAINTVGVFAADLPEIEKTLIENGITQYSPNLGNSDTCSATAINDTTIGKLPEETQAQFEAIRSKIEINIPFYEAASGPNDLPWQVLAALHWREIGLSRTNPGGSVNGEGLFGFTTLNNAHKAANGGAPLFPQGYAEDDQFQEQLSLAASELKGHALNHYDVDLTASSNFEDYKEAFLSYNRGSGYKNVPSNVSVISPTGNEVSGPWPPELSPYVMNGYSNDYLNMRFPDKGTSYVGRGPHWGEPASVRGKLNSSMGAMTLMLGAGFSPGNSTTCAGGFGVSGMVFPLDTSKEVVDTGSYYPRTGGVVWGKNSEGHKSPPSWSPYIAYDIGAPVGTPVRAVKDGIIKSVSASGGQMQIWLLGNDRVWYFYQHLDPDDQLVNNNTGEVTAGQTIGSVGPYALNANSGGNTPPHLHFNASTKRLSKLKRGCSQAECPEMDSMIDVNDDLIRGYEELPAEEGEQAP